MAKNVIEMKDVYKTYHLGEVDFQALCDVNLKIETNQFISIMGPSGSGKSTLLNMIGALDRPTAGTVVVGGQDISKLNDSQLATLRGKTIGFVFQTFNLINRLTTVENVMLPMWFVNNSNTEQRRERAIKLLELVGLGDKIQNRPSQLSGGERQRVAIARAISNDPDILLADEPTGNLDSKTGEMILEILKDLHKKRKVTLIMVTHDNHIANMAERKIRLKDGKVIGG